MTDRSDNPEDDFYALSYDLFDRELFWSLVYQFNTTENIENVEYAFNDFLDNCYKKYKSLIEENEDPYHYFNNILLKYKSLKKKLFFEKENKTFHRFTKKEISDNGDKVQRITCMHYYYINQIISTLEDYSTKTPKTAVVKQEQLLKPHGFNVKNQECLQDAYNQLINLEVIVKDVDFLDFEKVFLGRVPNNKITWLKGPGLLSYFIKSINGIGIRDEKKNIWRTTINCFQDSNGIDFDIVQLRHGKVPKNIQEIQMVIETFNQDSYQEE